MNGFSGRQDRRGAVLAPSEEEVVARLEQALLSRLAAEPVDVVDVARRTRVGVRRARVVRRLSVVAVAAAVAAVPLTVVATGGWRGDRLRTVPAETTAVSTVSSSPTLAPSSPPTASAQPTAMPTASDVPTPTPTASVALAPSFSPSVVATVAPSAGSAPWRVLPAGPIGDPTVVAYPIPDIVVPRVADFPTRMDLLSDLGDYRLQPTMMSQGCGPTRVSARWPVAARNWSWAQRNGRWPAQITVDLTVTGWAPGTVGTHWGELLQNTGPCRFSPKPTKASTTGLTGDQVWAATGKPGGVTEGYAAVRLGDVVVAVMVYHPAGTDKAVVLARSLAAVAAQRVSASGLTVTAASPQGS